MWTIQLQSRMNVTEQELKQYIEVFHSTLQATGQEYLPTDLFTKLWHQSLLPARITGYLSTQYGVAIEYEPAEQLDIAIVRGSGRVEDLLVQAPSQLRDVGPWGVISVPRISIYGIEVADAFPFRLTGEDASLTLGDVRFTAGGWSRTVAYAEVFGTRAKDYWSREKAVSRAKDEVIVALLEYERAQQQDISISDYIASQKQRTVLLLGDYNADGRKRLSVIRDVLVELGYKPLLIEDVPEHPHQDLPQNVVAVGAISRFVVVDDSSKSGHILEVRICQQNNWVTIVLRAESGCGSLMTAGMSHHSNVILEKTYDLSAPKSAIREAVEWAEAKLNELERKFDSTYPWRKVDS